MGILQGTMVSLFTKKLEATMSKDKKAHPKDSLQSNNRKKTTSKIAAKTIGIHGAMYDRPPLFTLIT